ncbi:MAG TPA: hypothetical protein VMV73_06525 [Candidatus Dormibacteraeota bacterium]|nr:hypothetical protein [Candidatus Dormibacteraeota bacterium]
MPSLLRNPRIPVGTAAIVITLSFIDASVPAPLGAVRTWLRRYTNAAPTLVMTAPTVTSLGLHAPTLAGMQRELYRRVGAAARTLHATLLPIGVPKDPVRYLQPDGMHPNERGERYIARRVLSWLRQQRFCA